MIAKVWGFALKCFWSGEGGEFSPLPVLERFAWQMVLIGNILYINEII